jgi:hypothetical protein
MKVFVFAFGVLYFSFPLLAQTPCIVVQQFPNQRITVRNICTGDVKFTLQYPDGWRDQQCLRPNNDYPSQHNFMVPTVLSEQAVNAC